MISRRLCRLEDEMQRIYRSSPGAITGMEHVVRYRRAGNGPSGGRRTAARNDSRGTGSGQLVCHRHPGARGFQRVRERGCKPDRGGNPAGLRSRDSRL